MTKNQKSNAVIREYQIENAGLKSEVSRLNAIIQQKNDTLAQMQSYYNGVAKDIPGKKDDTIKSFQFIAENLSMYLNSLAATKYEESYEKYND